MKRVLNPLYLVVLLFVAGVAGCKDKDVDADWAVGIAGSYSGSIAYMENGIQDIQYDVTCVVDRVSNKSVLFTIKTAYSSNTIGPLDVKSEKTFKGEVEVKGWDEFLVLNGVVGDNTLLVEFDSYKDSSKKTLVYSGTFSGVK